MGFPHRSVLVGVAARTMLAAASPALAAGSVLATLATYSNLNALNVS